MNDIVVSGAQDLTPDLIDQLTASSFMPFISLTQNNSDANTDKKAQPGEFMFGPNDVLGTEWIGLPIAYRHHAVLYDNKKNVLAESYDPNSKEFARVKNTRKSNTRRPNVGYDVLYFIPGRGFATFFFKNTFASNGRPTLQHMQTGEITQIRSDLAGKSDRWYVPVCSKYEGKVDDSMRPSDEAKEQALHTFANPSTRGGGEDESEPAEGKKRSR